jgi:hypothetical protein
MAIHYVDFEGEAGSGDGSSYANRAKRFEGLSCSAGDEIRVKQTSNPTVLTNSGKVIRTHGAGDYSMQDTSSNNIVYSTTTGQTYWDSIPPGWHTGDIIVIAYHNAPAGQNLNGPWRLTVDRTVSPDRGYFDGFTASSTATVSNHTIAIINGTANTIQLSSCPVKILASTDNARSAWTASSNVTTAIGYPSSRSNWNQYGRWQVPTGSDEIALSTSTSTGKAAYFALDSATDLSGYQQISFFFQIASGNANLSSDGGGDQLISLRLCTDTQGDTSVHTIPINNGRSSSNKFIVIHKDFGSNLNSSIQSIAIYVDNTLPSSVTFRLNNIIASKASSSADSLSLNSMLGLNTTADKIWYPLGYIIDRGSYCLAVLATWPQSRGSDGFGYYGNHVMAWWSQTFNSTTIYKREQVFPKFIKEGNMVGSSSNDQWSGNGSDGNNIVISGGWNDSDMTSIVGATFIRGSGMGEGLETRDRSYIMVKNLFYNAFNDHELRGDNCGYDNVGFCNSNAYPRFYGTNSQKYNIIYSFGTYGYGAYVQARNDSINTTYSDWNIHWCSSGQVNARPIYIRSSYNIHWNYVNTESSCNDGFFIDTDVDDYIFETVKCGWSRGGYTFRIYDSSNRSSNIRVKNLYSYTGGGVQVYSAGAGFQIDNYYHTIPSTYEYSRGRSFNESASYCVRTEKEAKLLIKGGSVMNRVYPQDNSTIKTIGVTLDDSVRSGLKGTPLNVQSTHSAKLLCKDYDNTSGDTRNFFAKGYIYPETTIRHTASGLAWRFRPSSTGLSNALLLDIGKVIVNSGSQVSVSVWSYASNPNNPVGFIRVKQNADLGMTADADADSTSNSSNTWTKITATFTPSASGIVEIQLGAHGGSGGSHYFDDIEVTQA